MKHNILTLLSGACLLSALAIAGCTKSIPEPSGFPEDGIVRISTGSPLTKAEGSSSAYEGTTLGLYVNYGIGELPYTKNNIQWTKNESGEWTPVDQMLWKNPTDGPTLWAYAPYNDWQLLPPLDTDFGKLEFTIPADQSAGITQADFVTWGQQNYVPDNTKNSNFSADGKVQVAFSHNLVKLTFNFTIRTQFEPGTTISKATLLGTTSKVSCDIFGSGVAKASDAVSRDIVLHKVSDLVFEGIFFPGDGQKAGSEMLKVEMSDGTVLTYTVGNADLNFESGKAYTMNMYLGKHEVEMSSVTLEPWENSETVINGGNGSETAVPVWSGSVASAFDSGTGTQADPFIIKTGEQLAYLAQQVNAGTNYSGVYFKLSNLINLGGKDWTPIGNSTNQFNGKFDGNGNSIYGLKVDSESPYAGLFGYAGQDSEISNLSVIEARVATNQNYAGTICGFLNEGTILNCSVVGGSVSAGTTRSGGICGQSYGSAKIENCSVSSTSISASEIVGGICGDTSGSLESCKGTDLTIAGGSWVGGITAACLSSTTTTIKNCSIYSSKILFQEPTNRFSRAGGLVANCNSNNLTISECSSEVDFYITNINTYTNYQRFIGGLFGYISQPGTFTNCHFDGCFMNQNGEVIDYKTESSSYTNFSGKLILILGAAIGEHSQGICTFINCSYNAGKTGNIPKVKTPIASQDYSGIIAK
ncbi:MAG: fimbrillin family protein [Candidatus Cryptobacteroides sp.]